MILVLIFVLNKFIASGFIPQEDQGYFNVELVMPVGTTIERTREVTERAVAYLSQSSTFKMSPVPVPVWVRTRDEPC